MMHARPHLLLLSAILFAGLVGCAPFDHSPQALSRSLSQIPESESEAEQYIDRGFEIERGIEVEQGTGREGAPQKRLAVEAPQVKKAAVRAQSPGDDYPATPMRPSGSPRVAQQPIYSPTPTGRYPLYGEQGGATTPVQTPYQTTVQPPPPNIYGGYPQGTTTVNQPVPGLPGAGQPYPLPSDNSIVPGFPDMAPNILGDRAPPPQNLTPLDIYVGETRTGKFTFGMGVNSDAGVTGQVTIDEKNFDAFNPATSFDDVLNGTAWRGRGQGLRLEAQPGNQVQRYLVSFTEPYLFDTPITMGLSAFYFERRYFDYNEDRVGGRMAYGYRLTPDLSISAAFRIEDVKINDPRVAGVSELDAVLGSTDFYSGRVTLAHDTRDNTFISSAGHYLELGLEQGFGEFSFPRAEIDYRQYFTVRERADGTGKHIVAFSSRLGFSGSDTPLFERYFAGGYSSLRGFAFRGASPLDTGVRVGGDFKFLNSLEYFFPLTSDDMIKGTLFCDFGTVEEQIEIKDFRVAPGFGVLFSIPALGPAPLALNFAFPIASNPGDQEQVFSFFFGATR